MALHVIAKIVKGKKNIGYRILDSNKRINKDTYTYKDCSVDSVKNMFIRCRDMYQFQTNNPAYRYADEICGFYYSLHTDRDSLRTPDGIPIIDSESKKVRNENSLMEIMPMVYVDFTGKIKASEGINKGNYKIVNVMKVEYKQNRKKEAGNKNLSEHRKKVSESVQNRVGLFD